MKTWKKWMALVVGMINFVAVSNTSAAEVMIEQDKKVIIGFDDTFAPFGFKNEQGDIVGFDVDLAKTVFERMGVTYKFQPIDWSTKETELTMGNIDMIWSGYTVTKERSKVLQFSDAYMDNRQIIVVRKDSKVQTKADLAGKIVATQAESSSLAGMLKDTTFVDSIDGQAPVTYATFVEVFADLDNGRADAIIVDETLATYFLSKNKQGDSYRILKEHFGEETYAVGFRKTDTAFVQRFNEALAAVKKDGTFAEITKKWFDELKQ
ncbi:amino acid ABC transporter substrate-binding protein [Aerococcaceae bacterium zg-BR22]|uniref:amino acid ABC transporter substrate-binding protein n=1 Tax=Aerococcaceae bacterium zg-1292 TaxID=2774330 RepID=UPI0040641B5D|nr:amino acid ABC transporter substrate-binding protein [Aerococcaceae bacterium zg-BR22]